MATEDRTCVMFLIMCGTEKDCPLPVLCIFVLSPLYKQGRLWKVMKVDGMNSPGKACSRNKQKFLTMERMICLQNLKCFEKIKENKGFVYVRWCTHRHTHNSFVSAKVVYT